MTDQELRLKCFENADNSLHFENRLMQARVLHLFVSGEYDNAIDKANTSWQEYNKDKSIIQHWQSRLND